MHALAGQPRTARIERRQFAIDVVIAPGARGKNEIPIKDRLFAEKSQQLLAGLFVAQHLVIVPVKPVCGTKSYWFLFTTYSQPHCPASIPDAPFNHKVLREHPC